MRSRIHTSDKWIRIREAQKHVDPDPQHCFDIATHHAGKGEDRGHQVVEDGRLDGHACLQQHREIADLVRQLVAQHRHARRETSGW